jgi:predicted signal transduction protein with EAL and GGDEF domain
MGDAVLKSVAQHIKSCVREGDTGARLGGDEFIVLLAHTDEPEQAARALANRLLDATSETFNVGENTLQIGLSIGIALAPKDGKAAEQLLKNVDLALYRAKSEGRGRFRFFDAAIDTPMLPEAQPLLAGGFPDLKKQHGPDHSGPFRIQAPVVTGMDDGSRHTQGKCLSPDRKT